MKQKKNLFIFAITGGIVGFIFHLVWHFKLNISLFIFSSHILNGIFYTLIGIIIGVFMWYLINKNEK